MRNWKVLLLVAMGVAMSGFFLAIMRPPGGQSTTPGRDLPWQVAVSDNGASSTVFGLTLGQSTLRDAVRKLGRRYEMGVFQERDRGLSLEAYFRDAVVGGLNARLVLSAHLPEEQLALLRAHAGAGQPTAGGGRHFPVTEADHDLALDAVVTAITYLPVVRLDADLVRKRFGEPAERLPVQDGMHWLYPPLGLDLLLGDNGGALLQYVPPAKFEQRLRRPLRQREREERP
ncbi:MAG: hypothetical protein KDJ54_19050 [Candidatus Competibacteraceae bacterium]|nr:hypothetical protein [Candidatus Competibacteraceae bacterium]